MPRINPSLPEITRTQLSRIIVERNGDHPAAFMRTLAVQGVVEGEKIYRLTATDLVAQPLGRGTSILRAALHSGACPSKIFLKGNWQRAANEKNCAGNILGGYGSFTCAEQQVMIPRLEATEENLATYCCSLFKLGDELSFAEAAEPLPVTIMEIGSEYIPRYQQLPEFGGGIYLEYHDRPHLHMPLSPDAGGCLLLGRRTAQGLELSAFAIPYGYAVYTAPWVIHNDGFLIGKVLVVYSLTENFSTVIIRDGEGRPTRLRIEDLPLIPC